MALNASAEMAALDLVAPKPVDRLVATFTKVMMFWPKAWNLMAEAAAAGVVAVVSAATGSVPKSVAAKPKLLSKVEAVAAAVVALPPASIAAFTATA
jgi:hypothetical protein